MSFRKTIFTKKPIKKGYKVWALADKNGYLWNIEFKKKFRCSRRQTIVTAFTK